MKLAEFISKELRCAYEVYLQNEDTLEADEKLFDSFFDAEKEDEVMKWKDNYHTYYDYEVVYFYARSTHETQYAPFNAIIKVIVKKPVNTEELPF